MPARLPALLTAGRVLVLHEGRVAQSGHHRELARVPGPYAGVIEAWRRT